MTHIDQNIRWRLLRETSTAFTYNKWTAFRSIPKWKMTVTPDISAEDLEQINLLREHVKDKLTPYYDTDFNLLRWLKGHNYNFDQIIPKLRNHLEFRASKWQLDTVADGKRDHSIHEHWRPGLTGDAIRTPNAIVNIEQSGTNDYWGMLHTYPINEIMHARLYDLELMLRTVIERERKTGQQTSIMYIMDLNGLSYDSRLLTLLTGALSGISAFMAEHYVELIHTFVLVNAPSFISAIWTIVRPVLPERTKNKVKILGANWRKEILEIAAPEVLPSYWNIPEEKEEVFKANVLRSIPFDLEGYYKGGLLDDSSDLLSVPARKVGFIERDAVQGNTLRWIFETDGHFAYAIFFTEKSDEIDVSKMVQVYPRFNKVPGPTYVPLQDHIVCPYSGKYKIWFSNEHAWLHTLKVHHKVVVER
uniref:CRAL-TRIO domain-containing protein n=1 Tax=Acrobeloides nanus TaxID=290746 RepID=A0A914DYN7_9BILA